MVVVVDLVVVGDGDGDVSAAQLGQHRNDPGKKFERMPVLALLLNAAKGSVREANESVHPTRSSSTPPDSIDLIRNPTLL